MVRALIVLVLFVAVTVLALSELHPWLDQSRAAGLVTAATTVTTTTKPAHPTTTTTTIPPSKVPVLVANASGVTGAAAAVSAQLQAGRLGTAAAGRRFGPGHHFARLLPGRVQTPGRRHRLVIAAPGHLGGPLYDGRSDQLDRDGGGGGGGGPGLADKATTSATSSTAS